MSYYIIEPDGTVISSSQHQVFGSINTQMRPMTGVILVVNPSDDPANLTGGSSPIKRGVRHECIVWAASDWGDPDTIITNVIIPPSAASGIDNYKEDLPRGCINTIDGSVFDLQFGDLDPAKLDGEWCVVDFIGGRIEYPFITNWWPHPANTFDPATSGSVISINPDSKLLEQYSKKTGKSRSIESRNGFLSMINKHGDYYISTDQGDRLVKLKGTSKFIPVSQVGQVQSEPLGPEKPGRVVVESAKGGNIQIDVKKTAQHEINLNVVKYSGARTGAGSTTNKPVHDPDLPHYDDPSTTAKPAPRETERTFIRHTAYSSLKKTSQLNFWVQNTTASGGKPGTATIVADDQITFSINGSKSTILTMKDGEIFLVNKDGTLLRVTDDVVSFQTKGGGALTLNSKNLSILAEGGVITTSPVQLGLDGADGITEFAMKAGSFVASFGVWSAALAAFLTLVSQDLVGVVGPSAKANTAALGVFTAATTAFLTGTSIIGPAFSWISKQIKVK